MKSSVEHEKLALCFVVFWLAGSNKRYYATFVSAIFQGEEFLFLKLGAPVCVCGGGGQGVGSCHLAGTLLNNMAKA